MVLEQAHTNLNFKSCNDLCKRLFKVEDFQFPLTFNRFVCSCLLESVTCLCDEASGAKC